MYVAFSLHDLNHDGGATEDALAGNERYLQMARNFASYAIDNLDALANIPDCPHSLYMYEGMMGLATLLLLDL